MTKNCVSPSVVGLLLSVSVASAADPNWLNHLSTATFFQGDSFGTAVSDMYIDQTNPGANFNGAGLVSTWAAGAERPAYVRFDNIFPNIPVGSFIVQATLRMTASAQSTGGGYLKAGNWGGTSDFNQTNDTYSSMGFKGRALQANPAGGANSIDQLYSKNFGGSLSAGQTVDVDITPAARSWFDRFQNPAQGYPNRGIALNVNPQGAGSGANSISFFDSENGILANRPELIVKYLDPATGMRARLYQPVTTGSAQENPTTMQDTLLRAFDQCCGDFDSGNGLAISNINYGAYPNKFYIAGNAATPSYAVFKWSGLNPTFTQGTTNFVFDDAQLLFSGSDNWNLNFSSGGSMLVRGLLQSWVEGTGNRLTSGTDLTNGVTWVSRNRSHSDPNVNPWQSGGASGSLDGTNLTASATVNLDNGQVRIGADALAEFIRQWALGGANNGLLVRPQGNGDFDGILSGNLGGSHLDPYLSPGILIVYEVPEASVALLVGAAAVLLLPIRRLLARGR